METLPQDIIENITSRLVREFNPERIFLFGSYAWGNPTPDSDIDLMVIVSRSDLKPVQRAIMAHRCLRGVMMPIDVLVKTRAEFEKFSHLNASLEGQIFRRGKILYERTN